MSLNLSVVIPPDPLDRLNGVAVVHPAFDVAGVLAQDKETSLHDWGQVTEDVPVLPVHEAPVHGVEDAATLHAP